MHDYICLTGTENNGRWKICISGLIRLTQAVRFKLVSYTQCLSVHLSSSGRFYDKLTAMTEVCVADANESTLFIYLHAVHPKRWCMYLPFRKIENQKKSTDVYTFRCIYSNKRNDSVFWPVYDAARQYVTVRLKTICSNNITTREQDGRLLLSALSSESMTISRVRRHAAPFARSRTRPAWRATTAATPRMWSIDFDALSSLSADFRFRVESSDRSQLSGRRRTGMKPNRLLGRTDRYWPEISNRVHFRHCFEHFSESFQIINVFRFWSFLLTLKRYEINSKNICRYVVNFYSSLKITYVSIFKFQLSK